MCFDSPSTPFHHKARDGFGKQTLTDMKLRGAVGKRRVNSTDRHTFRPRKTYSQIISRWVGVWRGIRMESFWLRGGMFHSKTTAVMASAFVIHPSILNITGCRDLLHVSLQSLANRAAIDGVILRASTTEVTTRKTRDTTEVSGTLRHSQALRHRSLDAACRWYFTYSLPDRLLMVQTDESPMKPRSNPFLQIVVWQEALCPY